METNSSLIRIQLLPRAVLAICALLLAALAPPGARGEFRSYHIGNSLTWDSQPEAMELFGNEFGPAHQAAYHIHVGWALHTIVADPNSLTIEPVPEFGSFDEALVNHAWDAVTLQPHRTQSANLQTDVESMLSLIDLTRTNSANENTTFYIYQAWPSRIGLSSYQSQWDSSLPVGSHPDMEYSREYFDLLYDTVHQATDADLQIIPVGEVLYELDRKMTQGAIPGYNSVLNLYRDHTHLDNELGRYVASATTFASLSGVNPLDLYKPPGFAQKNLFPLSDDLYAAVNTVIRDVLNAETRSEVYFPVADFDGNGVIGQRDLTAWTNSYPGLQFDPDENGTVDGVDFLHWQIEAAMPPIEFDDSHANLDGIGLVDSGDLRIWESSYGNDSLADLDGDSDTDGLDFLTLQQEFTPFHVADINRDRKVDRTDLAHWDTSYGYAGVVDADSDSVATGLDFLIWQRETGLNVVPVSTSVSSVPEPQSATLFLILALLGLKGLGRASGR